MKKEITAYITGVINSYTKTVAILNENNAFNTNLNSFVAVKEEFSELLNYVMDIPEENKEQLISNFNISLENENLKQTNAKLLSRVMELEESCENMNEVERNLHYKIKGIEKEMNEAWEQRKHVNQININLMTELSELKKDNADWKKACNELRAKNRDLTGPRWVQD